MPRQSVNPTPTSTPTTHRHPQPHHPRHVAVARIDTSNMDSNLEKDDKYEIKSGKLLLLHRVAGGGGSGSGQQQPPRAVWFPVHVRVYRNAFEHFAVVSKDQAISTTGATYVNLRAATCSPSEDSERQFQVVQNNYEGTVIRFDAGDRDSVWDWVEAFTCPTPPGSPTLLQGGGGMSPTTLSPAIPRSPVMPTLTELDEEE
ncbi:uncharacterized protein LOC143283947 [Babylonia areolata]|uniref:uncharacterized protein LOC143283947 n=1 Tax=Babylonia areolata TaxID=304850 RepID=UPI003FD1D5D6